jgi:glycerol-3-phosphate dehydrogenase
VLEIFPGLQKVGLSGAAIFSETQMHDSSRLALALLRSAVEAGAQVANGLEARGIVRKGITVTGVGVSETRGGESFVVRSKMVVNTAGAWAARILEEGLGVTLDPPLRFSRRISLVVNRRPAHRIGLALLDETREAQTPLSRSSHHLFMLPWRNQTVLGAWHRDHPGTPDDTGVTDEEIETCISEINARYPILNLHPDDLVQHNAALGLLERHKGSLTGVRDAAHARFIDHAVVHGTRGIVSLVGAIWGSARLDAARLVDDVCRRLGIEAPETRTSITPVFGGDIESLEQLTQDIHDAARAWGLTRESAQAIGRNHGTAYGEIFDLINDDPNLGETLPGTGVLRAEVVHAVRNEMALTLDDVVQRRTHLGVEPLSRSALDDAARLMALEFGWSPTRIRQEVRQAAPSDRGGESQIADFVRA